MTSAHRAISVYVQTGLETGVAEASSHRLISMLFDGAIQAIAEARIRLARGEIGERGQAISKAITIVDDGLRRSLDLTQGGELAERLDVLYHYICSQLLTANLRADAELLMEADRLLTQLQDAWKAIGEPQKITEMAHAAHV